MTRRPLHPSRNYAEHHADWRRLALRTIAALEADDLDPNERRSLGDLAAMARNSWTFPAPPPNGNVAGPLAVGALCWTRLDSDVLRRQLAPGVRAFADAVLQLLMILDSQAPAAERPAPALRFRADIDG